MELKDAYDNPIREGFYVDKRSQELFELFKGDAGYLWVRCGFTGKGRNILDLNECSNYRPATPQELKTEIHNCRMRIGWIETGLSVP